MNETSNQKEQPVKAKTFVEGLKELQDGGMAALFPTYRKPLAEQTHFAGRRIETMADKRAKENTKRFGWAK